MGRQICWPFFRWVFEVIFNVRATMNEQKQLTKKRFTLESLAVLLILITPFLFKDS
jgi:hypothetical protein